MNWNPIKVLAVSVVLGTSIPTMALAATPGPKGFSRAAITLDGKTVSAPYKTVASDGSNMTTFMPLYYIEQALTKAGYKSTWDGKTHTWNLTLTSHNVDLSNLQVGTGNTSIVVNGKLVKKVNTIVRRDPAGGSHAVPTTYVPIYYVQPLLQAVGVKNAWNGQAWSSTSPITLATATTYGPTTGVKNVSQNLVITGNGVTVQNTKIDGNIYVDPGSNGTVYLTNVTVTGSIVVLSGAQQSVHLTNVNAQSLEVNSVSPVHIVSNGTTNIAKTTISSDESQGVNLEQQSGSFGDVHVASGSSVTLAGTTPFKGLTVSGSGTLTVGDGVVVTNLNITGPKITVNISSGATVTTLTVNKNVTGVSIVNNGKVETLQNNGSSSGLSLSGTGTITTTLGNTPTGTETGGGAGAGGAGGFNSGGSGGTGGSGSSVSTAQKDASLAKLAAELQSLHEALVSTGGLSAVELAENNARALTKDEWGQVVYDTAYNPTNTEQAKVVTAVKDLVMLATFGQLESDQQTTSTDVQTALQDVQAVDANITGTDLYNLYENFKIRAFSQAAGDIAMSTTTVSVTQIVSDALQLAITDTTDGTDYPFSDFLTQSGLSVSDIAAIRTRAETAVIGATDATNALFLAAGTMEFQPQATSVSVGQTVTYSLALKSTAPSELQALQSVLPGHISWSSSNTNITINSSSGVVTGVAPGTAVITATVHGYKVFEQTITVTVHL